MPSEVEIRLASRSDAASLASLARAAGEPRPAAPCLVAVVDGRLCAALSLRGGPVVAHPKAAGTGIAGRLRLAAAEEVGRRQSGDQRARSRRLRATFARING